MSKRHTAKKADVTTHELTDLTDTEVTTTGPWHRGEVLLHTKLGVAERMAAFGPNVIRNFMPDQHRDFYGQLPLMLIGSVDDDGNPWASVLEGTPGFAHSPSPRQLAIDARPSADDPATPGLTPGAAVGLLGIELHSRRRNRINGRITANTSAGLTVAVDQAFGNCPQYIQLRNLVEVIPAAANLPVPAMRLGSLDAAARAMISAADTCFVASYVDVDGDTRKRAVDVSHRGGRTGFVQIDSDRLTIPDFAGNLHFNTLGNLLLNPRAGLLFIDFGNGDLLHVTGTTEIIFDGPEVAAFQGAERLWRLQVTAVVRRPAALALRWRFDAFSPNSLMTGTWEQTEQRLQAEVMRDAWRPFRIARIADETPSVRSFYLEPADGAGMPGYHAGQHLPIRLRLPGTSAPVIRTYSLSSAPSDNFFRISVKRAGAASELLHDDIKVDDVLEARAPQGSFVLDPVEQRPLVLLGAGVGVTPLLSMLRETVYEGRRSRRTRHTYFVQGARHVAELPFSSELRELAARSSEGVSVVRVVSQPEARAREGRDFEVNGHIDLALLKALLHFDDFDFYLCGPTAFTQQLYDGLRALHIRDERIHAEAFGPSGLRRQVDKGAAPFVQSPMAELAQEVRFAR